MSFSPSNLFTMTKTYYYFKIPCDGLLFFYGQIQNILNQSISLLFTFKKTAK